MVNPEVSLLDLKLKVSIPGDVMSTLIDDKNIVYVYVYVDMVNEGIEEDSNTTCDEDSNTTCDEVSNTTCVEDSNTTCNKG